MSSPRETVNAVMEWLNEQFHAHLPVLPFHGVWQRFTSLWQLFIIGPLPQPGSPLPWVIDVEGSWDDVIPGTHVSLQNIQIVVSEGVHPSSPDVPSPPDSPSPPHTRK